MRTFKKIMLIAVLITMVAMPAIGCNKNDVVVIEKKVNATEATKYSSMEEYVKSKDMQAVEKQLNEENHDKLSIKLKAEGDSLVYEYTLINQSDDNLLAIKSSLQTQLRDNEENSKTIAYSLKNYVHVENPSIIIRYLTKTGKFIIEQEYKVENQQMVPVQQETQATTKG